MKPGTVCFVLALVLAGTLAVTAAPASAGSAAAPDAAATTIGVRGHWLIQVADPDGTVVAVREFHNALLPDGERTLVLLLGGNRSAGAFAVLLTSPQSSASPCAPVPFCGVAEPRFGGTASASLVKTLSKIVVTAPSPSIVLRGSIQVPAAGDVSGVTTNIVTCGISGLSTIAPAACQPPAGGTQVFTQTTLPTPVSVVAGQTVLATVTLTFGTATVPAAPASR
jgi:hypothetical protein